MQIKRLGIRNFRSIEVLDVEIGPAAAIVGPNGAGKSSILAAIQFALFGRCEFTGAGGQGSKDLIRNGGRQAVILLQMHTAKRDIWIAATINQKGKNNFDAHDGDGLVFDTRRGLWSALGVDPEIAEAAANPFAWMSDGNTAAVFRRLVGGDDVPGNLLRYLDDEGDRKFAEDFAARHTIALNGPDDFESLGIAMFTQRTDTKRALKAAELELEGLPFAARPLIGSPDPQATNPLEQIKRGKGDLVHQRSSLERLLQLQGAAQHAATPERIAELTAKAQRLADEITIAHNDLQEQMSDGRALGGKLEELRAAPRKSVQIVARLDALDDGETCPTCGARLSPEEAQAAAAEKCELQEKLVKAMAAEAERDALIERWGDELETRGKIRDTSNAAWLKLCEEHAAAKAALEAAKPAADIPADIDAQVEAKRADIAATEGIIKELEAWRDYSGQQKAVERLKAEVGHLDAGVKAYRDGAAINALLGDRLQDVIYHANAILQPHRTTLSYTIDGKHVRFYAHGRRIEHTSTGERTIAAFALVRAVPDAPILLDDANHLDGYNRAELVDFAQAVAAPHADEDSPTILLAWTLQSEDTDTEIEDAQCEGLNVIVPNHTETPAHA